MVRIDDYYFFFWLLFYLFNYSYFIFRDVEAAPLYPDEDAFSEDEEFTEEYSLLKENEMVPSLHLFPSLSSLFPPSFSFPPSHSSTGPRDCTISSSRTRNLYTSVWWWMFVDVTYGLFIFFLFLGVYPPSALFKRNFKKN